MIANDGHDIANHSYSHAKMGTMDKRDVEKEINACSSKLTQISGSKVDLFRPPYGDYSNNVINTAKSLGHYTIQWDVDSLDWKPDISKQQIYERVVTKVNPGSIILFHNDTKHTANVLPEIIASLKKDGYSFVPVSELILRENYIIDFKGQQKRKE
jgi:peptidoglycan/xylan/chitin deacetylase (PgdA/CDA1 family)